MSIKRRIWSLPTTAIVIFSIGLAICVYFSTLALNSINLNSTVDYPTLDKSKAFTIDVERLTKEMEETVGEGDKNRLGSVEKNAQVLLTSIKSLAAIPGQADNAARIEKEFNDYFAPATKVAKIMLGTEEGDATPSIAAMISSLKILKADLAKQQESAQRQFDAGVEISSKSVKKVLYTIIAVAVIVIAILLGSSFVVVRGIWLQLGGEPEYTRDIAVSIAAGDLSMDIDADKSDSNSLLTALKDMKSRLELMISNIKTSAQTIKTASAEIAEGNNDLSNRTESQASSLQKTASSMHDIGKTVNQNAENASLATQLAHEASDVALKGGTVVSQVINTMAEINGSSKKIVDIISVIDSIAFQTNILALNAAVEAARAGEQGRGFAVVASEVRNLAQRSASAAKEIKMLISDSVDKVTHGSRLVDQAGHTMDEIVASVQRVADIMKDIASASQEQSVGIHQIDTAISYMDEMTQQNSALVEQAAAAAASMQNEAENLMTTLEVFKLSTGSTAQFGMRRQTAPMLT